ncbi:MAG: type II secretion system protein N [Spongiibacteraceae bacterium]
MPDYSLMFSPRLRRGLIVAAALWFLSWLLVLAPAAATVRLLRWSVPQLELAAIDGSFWRGSAGQAFVTVGNQRIALGRLDWQLNGWSLLWLHPSAKISSEWGEQIVTTRLRVNPLGSVRLHELRAALPVELLKIWAPLPARGTLALNLDAVDFSRTTLQKIDGSIDWRRAQWQWGDRWLALADYQLNVATHNDGMVAGKISGAGDLAATGTLTANLETRAYDLNAQLSASRALPQEFRDSLVFLLRAQPVNTDASAGGPVVMKLQRTGSW